MDKRDLELREGIADLQPRPEREGGDRGDADNGPIARNDGNEVARRQSVVRREEFRGAQKERAEQVGVGDDAAGSRGDGEPGQQTRGDRTCRVITRMASVAQVIAATKGTSIGVKNRLP